MCLKELCKHCDELYLRFDNVNGDKEILNRIPMVCGTKLKDILVSNKTFHKWHWREEMLRQLDNTKCDIVISIDEDEILDKSIDLEIKEFQKSNKNHMWVSYNSMPTEDGKSILNGLSYPKFPHVKVYKWYPNMTYDGYHGNCLIPKIHNNNNRWIAKSKITHYCFYKNEWIKNKIENMKTYSVKNYFKTYYGTTLCGYDT